MCLIVCIADVGSVASGAVSIATPKADSGDLMLLEQRHIVAAFVEVLNTAKMQHVLSGVCPFCYRAMKPASCTDLVTANTSSKSKWTASIWIKDLKFHGW